MKDTKHIGEPDATVVVGPDLKIVAFSKSAERITGLSEKELFQKNIEVLFKNTQNELGHIIDCFQSGKPKINLTLKIITKDDLEKSVFTSITPIRKSDNSISSVVLIFRDTTEMLDLFESLNEKVIESENRKNMLEAIFESRIEGTFTIDNDWVITSFNHAAEGITGFNRKEAIGKKCWEVFKSRLCQNGCHMENTINKHKRSVDNELIITRKGGEKLPIRVNSSPLFNADKEYIGGVETFRDISELANLKKHLQERYRFENMVGHSKEMQNVYVKLENVANSDSTVLITGESGTGKELVARAIHLHSDRRIKPFTVVNCSAFAESLLESELFGHERGAFTGAVRTKPGHLELAQEGTLFLDEIGDISLPVQVKLLRVLETRKFERVGGTKTINMNARLICATNKNLEDEVGKNRFREDFYYRINVFNIHLPPLRKRLVDLPLLLDHILVKLSVKFKKRIQTISPEALNYLKKHHWPGNIRELENALEHAFILCHDKVIDSRHLPEWLLNQGKAINSDDHTQSISDSIQLTEKMLLRATLDKYNGNRSKTAAELGIDPSTLWRKMKKYNMFKK
jgi:PAS domain S-box-containing protein